MVQKEEEVSFQKLQKYIKLEMIHDPVTVYKYWERETGDYFAIAKIILYEEEYEESPTVSEIDLLKEVSHMNIMRIIDVIYMKEKLYLVFEYIQDDLHGYIYRPEEYSGKLTPELVKSYLYQLLCGMNNCHERGVIHGNLHARNLWINGRGELKIAGAGLKSVFCCYSPWANAPEILLGSPKKYSKSIDIWAIGSIFAEMVIRKPLFFGDSEIDQMFNICKILGTPNEDTWLPCDECQDCSFFPKYPAKNLADLIPGLEPEGLDLLSQFLQIDPSKRISAKDALSHPYFDSIVNRNKEKL